MRKILVPAFVAAVAAPLCLFGAVTPANAATSCYATGCTGKVAANTTCVNDAEVIYQDNIYNGSTVIGNIELKYSPSCRAAWARVISNLGDGSSAEVNSNASSSLWENCYGSGGAGTGCNTDMIDDATTPTQTYTAYAIGSVIDSGGNYHSAITGSY